MMYLLMKPFRSMPPLMVSRYALETLMGRVPLPHTLFEHFDEIFGLGLLLAEWKSVISGDALLGERLFGLRRSRRTSIQQNHPARNDDSSMASSASGVRRSQSSRVSAMIPLSSRHEHMNFMRVHLFQLYHLMKNNCFL